MATAVCGGAGEVFGLDPQAGEWALSRCTEELATVALGAVFATAFLLRLARARHCCAETPAQPVQSASIYGSDVDGEESEGLLSPSAVRDSDAALITTLAADRSADAVAQLRLLADVDIFTNHESAALRRLGYLLAATAFVLRCWNASLLVVTPLSSLSLRSGAAAGLELLAWATSIAAARAETARRQPRSSLVMGFWGVAAFAPASTALRALIIAAMSEDGSTADGSSAVPGATATEVHLAIASVLVSVALICIALGTVAQQHHSTVWHTFQGAWSMQREGTGEGALDRLMGLGDSKERRRGHHRRGGSWCPEKGGEGSASMYSKVRRLVRLGRPDVWYIGLGISGFVLHASSKVWYQLLWGRLINAVYAGDRDGATTFSWQILLASMMAVWFDQYASVFLSIGGARLSVRLQRQVFNLIMEQDAAFFDRMKTGSLMTILSTNVGSIQNVLVHQTADLAEVSETS
jgi:hypothetical protein